MTSDLVRNGCIKRQIGDLCLLDAERNSPPASAFINGSHETAAVQLSAQDIAYAAAKSPSEIWKASDDPAASNALILQTTTLEDRLQLVTEEQAPVNQDVPLANGIDTFAEYLCNDIYFVNPHLSDHDDLRSSRQDFGSASDWNHLLSSFSGPAPQNGDAPQVLPDLQSFTPGGSSHKVSYNVSKKDDNHALPLLQTDPVDPAAELDEIQPL
ncbi:MAG: hypothetical protein CYPHOPRED_002201 [Cyphobasidiales sp. Tagirdzhanova-0007]|nr:MAG: hypothetical protein CYPHOPRED_002201 [Cyphobasidiales sp. Tagirdzhanova-0007]